MSPSDAVPLMIDSKGIRTQGKIKADTADIYLSDPESPMEYNPWRYWLALPMMYVIGFWAMLKVFFSSRRRQLARQIESETDPAKKEMLKRQIIEALDDVDRSILFDKLGPHCRLIRLGAASWPALNIIYNYRFGEQSGLERVVDDFWIGMRNAQAVRNRRRLIVAELTRSLKQMAAKLDRPVEILSIACGSTQALLEAIKRAFPDDVGYHLTLVDVDSKAFEMAGAIAEKLGLSHLETFEGTFSQYTQMKDGQEYTGPKFDLVEIIGLLDYRPDEKISKLCDSIRRVLNPGGLFATGHICPNRERFFLKWVINWRMRYRTPGKLRKLILAGGWQPNEVRVTTEPHGIHAIALCQL